MKNCFSTLNFLGKPENYAVIDKYVSRSAQPQKEDFAWLKSQGVTDIFNFRTMNKQKVNFDEEKEVAVQGLRYHAIPSTTIEPKEENVNRFLKEIEEVKAKGGKAHIHCMAGADRTGMYSFIYKMKNHLGTQAENIAEWCEHGFHYKKYSNLIPWAEKFLLK